MTSEREYTLRPNSTRSTEPALSPRFITKAFRILSTTSELSVTQAVSGAAYQLVSPSTEEFTAASHLVIDQPEMLEFLAELREAVRMSLLDYGVTFRSQISQSCEEDDGIETSVVLLATVASDCPIDLLSKTSEDADDLIAQHPSAHIRSGIAAVFDCHP